MTGLVFNVYGLPAPQGSKRHVGNGVMVESSKHLGTWREDVKLAALRALDENPDWDRDADAVLATVVFCFPRPRKHFRTGKHAHELRDDAPLLHTTTPDLDKLLRSTADALASAGVYRNDSRLAQVFAAKKYVTPRQLGVELCMSQPGALIGLTAVSYFAAP